MGGQQNRRLAKKAEKVVLETHGRWLLPTSVDSYADLLNTIQTTGTLVKVSFDSMHGTSSQELKMITDLLEKKRIEFAIAVTESSEAQFLIAKQSCDWIRGDRFVFQLKGTRQVDLIKPAIGVIGVDGILKESLTTKPRFNSLEFKGQSLWAANT